MGFKNYFLPSKYSKLTDGHINADELEAKIRNHDGAEAYYCVFDCNEGELQNEDGKQTFKGYLGRVRPALGIIQFDFDSDQISDSLEDCRKFLEWLDINHYSVAFSGSKGFHLGVPFLYFGLQESSSLPQILSDLAKELEPHFPTLDTSVYNANRKFRVLNSKHPKTGLYKQLIPNFGPGDRWDVESIKELAGSPSGSFYEPWPKDLKPCPAIVEVLERIKDRPPIEIEKGGSANEPTAFEKFDGKICIQRMLKDRAPRGVRNELALRIVNDFYKIGRHEVDAREQMLSWASRNGLEQSEVETILTNVYSGRQHYNHGCLDSLKAERCSGKCPIYSKLDPAKRANVVDAPKSAMVENEKSKAPKEVDITRRILTAKSIGCVLEEGSYFGGNLIKQGRDLFRYLDGYWQHLNDNDLDVIKTKISKAFGEWTTYRKVDSAFKHFILFVPPVPKNVDMFSPNQYAVSFLDGTLHMVKDSVKFKLEFRSHERDDYITNMIDLNYRGALWGNDKFNKMLNDIFDGDVDHKDKIRCIRQTFGAAIMPCFPHVFFFHGKSHSGKSTIMLVLKELLGNEKNISNIQPHMFSGFHMESMANKLINLVLDINTRKPMNEDMIKQIEDRTKISIQRKGIKNIEARLPAVHIFGGNALPPVLDGSHKTLGHRVSAVKFNKVFKGKKYRDVALRVFESDPHGILWFALEGLKDLVESEGWYINPQSGIQDVIEWEEDNDPITTFIKEINSESGAIYMDIEKSHQKICKIDDEFIKRSELWQGFLDWGKTSGYERHGIKRGQFFKQFRNAGYNIDHKRDGHFGVMHYKKDFEG